MFLPFVASLSHAQDQAIRDLAQSAWQSRIVFIDQLGPELKSMIMVKNDGDPVVHFRIVSEVKAEIHISAGGDGQPDQVSPPHQTYVIGPGVSVGSFELPESIEDASRVLVKITRQSVM